ncbi:MAG: ABC transporter ATP-binding protein [Chthoniobacterales bacterium]|jgi:predicted ABC-type transport system involved in lysophospholipase L1 biosynthesis ATPase subunit
MADEIHLRARGLHKAFRLGSSNLEILRGVDLDVKRGERVFLCGASGAGKSTLLYTLAGLERPTSGEVRFEGQDLYRVSAARQAALRNTRMGFVFQSYMLLPELTALENVALPGLIGGRPDRDRAGQLLEGVGLGDRAGHLPSELSGGEQQRVAMARALANRPTMLFADEPTGNLDSKTGGEIVDLLLGLTRANGTTLLAVTHDAELAARGDRVLHIRDGQLEES